MAISRVKTVSWDGLLPGWLIIALHHCCTHCTRQAGLCKLVYNTTQARHLENCMVRGGVRGQGTIRAGLPFSDEYSLTARAVKWHFLRSCWRLTLASEIKTSETSKVQLFQFPKWQFYYCSRWHGAVSRLPGDPSLSKFIYLRLRDQAYITLVTTKHGFCYRNKTIFLQLYEVWKLKSIHIGTQGDVLSACR